MNHPYDLILLGSEWGVAAYCEKKQEIRRFYINRIKNIKLLENFYKIKKKIFSFVCGLMSI
jgi:predicted DNA-binding transcriptional regulator YafY